MADVRIKSHVREQEGMPSIAELIKAHESGRRAELLRRSGFEFLVSDIKGAGRAELARTYYDELDGDSEDLLRGFFSETVGNWSPRDVVVPSDVAAYMAAATRLKPFKRLEIWANRAYTEFLVVGIVRGRASKYPFQIVQWSTTGKEPTTLRVLQNRRHNRRCLNAAYGVAALLQICIMPWAVKAFWDVAATKWTLLLLAALSALAILGWKKLKAARVSIAPRLVLTTTLVTLVYLTVQGFVDYNTTPYQITATVCGQDEAPSDLLPGGSGYPDTTLRTDKGTFRVKDDASIAGGTSVYDSPQSLGDLEGAKVKLTMVGHVGRKYIIRMYFLGQVDNNSTCG